MFERFTDRARRVVVLAQEEARLLKHNYIGTEHLLLGLIREDEGVAAQALESLGIGLDAVRVRVGEIVGEGDQAPSGHIPFTPRAKKVLELSLREALHLGHNYIGTKHILLGLIAEGHGVAAQVLAELDADAKRVRAAVVKLLPDTSGEVTPAPGPVAASSGRRDRAQLTGLRTRMHELEARLAAIEGRAGTGPDERAIDSELVKVRADKEAAVQRQDYERAAQLRDVEKRLADDKKARKADWELAHPDLPTLAGKFARLSAEVDRLRELLARHGIDASEPGQIGESAAGRAEGGEAGRAEGGEAGRAAS